MCYAHLFCFPGKETMWIFHPHFFHSLFSLVSSSRGRFGASRSRAEAPLLLLYTALLLMRLHCGASSRCQTARPLTTPFESKMWSECPIKMTNIKKIASETKCTIVVIGDSRTGKSALLHRFVHKTFQPVSFLKTWHLFPLFVPITNNRDFFNNEWESFVIDVQLVFFLTFLCSLVSLYSEKLKKLLPLLKIDIFFKVIWISWHTPTLN